MMDWSYLKSCGVGAAGAAGVWCSWDQLPNVVLIRDVADSLAGVSGTLAGFLLTCISIVIAVTPEDKVMQELKRVGSIGMLVRRSGWSVILLVIAAIAASVTRLAEGSFLKLIATATAFLTTFGISLLVASGREYLRVFGYMSKR